MDGLGSAAVNSALLFATLTVTGTVVMMVSTYTTCSKMDFSNAIKNGAISGSVPSIAFFVASYFEFVRHPFTTLFVGFGVEEAMAAKLGCGYIMMLFLWPMIVWCVHDSETKTCVPSVDEMTHFQKAMMEKLNAKKHTDAANTKAPVQSPAT